MKILIKIFTVLGVVSFGISIFLAVLRNDVYSIGFLGLSLVFAILVTLISYKVKKDELVNLITKYHKNEKDSK